MQGFERVPDAIEPLIGYRAWYFSVEHHAASLFPIGNPDPSGWSAWNGANDGWVSAACTLDQRQVPPESVKRCLEGSVRNWAIRQGACRSFPLFPLSLTPSRASDARVASMR